MATENVSIFDFLVNHDYLPHGHCYLWTPDLLWTYVFSDAIIGIAYYSIPIALYILSRKRDDLVYPWVFILFAMFIFACGTTHFIAVWTIWEPVYSLDAGMKAITAVISIFTAIALWPLLPRIIAIPSMQTVTRLNEELQREIVERTRTAENYRHEIQQRKKAEQAARDSAQRLNLVLAATEIGTWEYDPQTKHFNHSGLFDHLLGYAEPIPNLTFGRIREQVLPQDLKAFDAGMFEEQEGAVEFRIRRPDGEVRWISNKAKKIELDNGNTNTVGIIRDITETKKWQVTQKDLAAAEAREKAERKFRLVVEGAPNAKIMINESGLIMMVNTQAERLFGYDRSELLGQPVEILLPESLREKHPHLRSHFFQTAELRPMGAGRELYARRKDGSEVPVEIGLNPIETEEGTMVLSAIIDISERKLREEKLQAALVEKEVLLREIHHRVKNNLQIIDSLIELQRGTIMDTSTQDKLLDCQNRIRAMSMIHRKLYQTQDFAGVSFKDFVESLGLSLIDSYRLNTAPVTLTVDGDDITLDLQRAIPCGLIINELIVNSLKHAFLDDSMGHIHIVLTREDDEQITLEVGDDGVGLPDDLGDVESSGLGLQLVRVLSEQIEGELTITRHPTLFSIRFSYR